MEYLLANEAARYCLVSCLGRGSTASVFKAMRSDAVSQIEQPVAVKILHSETDVQKWRDEFYSLFRMESQHCVRVYGFDRIKGHPALILELVEGASLHDLLEAGMAQDIPWQEVAHQVSQGLIDLHSAQLIHGDLSPANVLIRRDGCVKLTDFGFGNVQRGKIETTPEYAAPEVLSLLEAPSTSSDWYSLAQILSRHSTSLDHHWIQQTLTARPEDRCVPKDVFSSNHRHQLGEIVQKYLISSKRPMTQRLRALGEHIRDGTTWWPKRSYLKGTFAMILSAFIQHGSVDFSWSSEPFTARLTVRSQKWVKVLMNGQEMGYAPLKLEGIKAGVVRLDLISARNRKQRILTLLPGSHMVIAGLD